MPGPAVAERWVGQGLGEVDPTAAGVVGEAVVDGAEVRDAEHGAVGAGQEGKLGDLGAGQALVLAADEVLAGARP